MLLLLLAVGLLTVVLLLGRRQSEKSEQSSEEARGSNSRADTSQRSASESPDVHLRVEGEVVKNNRHDYHLQVLLEDQVPELKGEIRSGSMRRVEESAVLVRVSQTSKGTARWDLATVHKSFCAPKASGL